MNARERFSEFCYCLRVVRSGPFGCCYNYNHVLGSHTAVHWYVYGTEIKSEELKNVIFLDAILYACNDRIHFSIYSLDAKLCAELVILKEKSIISRRHRRRACNDLTCASCKFFSKDHIHASFAWLSQFIVDARTLQRCKASHMKLHLRTNNI